MRWLFVGFGCFCLILFVRIGAGLAFSPRQRQGIESFGTPPALMLGGTAATGAGLLVTGLLDRQGPGLMVVWLAPLGVVGMVHRRYMARRDDLPPPLARMVALPTNPLTLLRHPLRTARGKWAAYGHPLRDRREMKQWNKDRREDDRSA